MTDLHQPISRRLHCLSGQTAHSSSKSPWLNPRRFLRPTCLLSDGAMRNAAAFLLSYTRSFIFRRRSCDVRLRSSMSSDRCEIISARSSAICSKTAVANFSGNSGSVFITLHLRPSMRFDCGPHSLGVPVVASVLRGHPDAIVPQPGRSTSSESLCASSTQGRNSND